MRPAVFSLLLLIASAVRAEAISSPAGEMYKLVGAQPAEAKELAYRFKVISTDRTSEKWAPMVFVGAIDVESQAQFQIFITQKAHTGDLVLGHRYLQGDNLVFSKPLFHGVPLMMDIEIVISLNEQGLLIVEQPLAGARHEYETEIQTMRSFFGVSGAEADIRLAR